MADLFVKSRVGLEDAPVSNAQLYYDESSII